MTNLDANRVPFKTGQANSTEIVVITPANKNRHLATDDLLADLLHFGWRIARDSTGKAYAMCHHSLTEGRA